MLTRTGLQTGPEAESRIPARLTRVQQAAADIRVFEFEAADGRGFGDFEPGMHVDVCLPSGMIRQYSLLPPMQDRLRFAVKREASGRGGSIFLHDHLKVGDLLTIGEARNNFPLRREASHSIFIAGGIGVTPFIGMIEEMARCGGCWELHYRARERAAAAFLGELGRYGEAIHASFSDEGHAGGRSLSLIVESAPPDAYLYCCGPEAMISTFVEATKGRDPDKVHVEHFAPVDEAAAYGGYTVEFRRSERSVVVRPGETILDAAIRVGIDVSYSCSEGICGSCETRVLAGTPDHRDAVLSPSEQAEGRLMMICCSGCKDSCLVLDL